MRRKASRWRGRALRAVALLLLGMLGVSFAAVGIWRVVDPPTSAFILHYESESDRRAYQRWADLEDISPHLALAVIAAEDQKFPAHYGFDFESIQKVVSEGEARGASTISQQVAKNLYLWPDRSWFRKALEAWLTLWIEGLWPKARILEVYLNVAEFGPGLYGAEAASQRFFDRSAASLSADQAARLAAVLPSPRRMSADPPSSHVRKRAQEIREQMRLLGGSHYLDPIREP